MTPAYLNDIEKGNCYAPEKYLDKLVELLNIGDVKERDRFYDLAGKSRNNNYPDLTEYIGKTDIARVALRKAHDYDISKSQWQDFIDTMHPPKNKK